MMCKSLTPGLAARSSLIWAGICLFLLYTPFATAATCRFTVQPVDFGLYKRAQVKLAARLGALEEVWVLLP